MEQTVFNDTSIMTNVTWTIDGQILDEEDVVTAGVHWNKNKFSVTGSVFLKDNSDSSNLFPLNSENELQLYVEDRFQDYFFKTFIFADVTETKINKRIKVMRYNIIDKLSYAMHNTYVSKSYAGVLLSDIIADFFGAYGWSELLDANVSLELLPTEHLHDYIIVPQDRSFLEFIKEELEKEGYTMYQTRKNVRIGVKKDDVTPTKLPIIDLDSFSQHHTLTEHPFRIHEHKNTFNPDLEQSNSNPLQSITTFSFANKMTMPMNKLSSSFADVFADFKVGTSVMNNIQKQVGEKLDVLTNNKTNTIKSLAQEGVHKTNQLSIVVTGNSLYNNIYMNADVQLNGSMQHMQGQLEGDVRMSGTYTIVSVTDQFYNTKMIQKLDMQRANFMEV